MKLAQQWLRGGVFFALLFPAVSNAQVDVTLGLKLWNSDGKTQWDFTSGSPTLGDPTSQLSYTGMKALTYELNTTAFWRRKGFFVRGQLGFGKIDHGILRDEDWDNFQVKFSDTNSDLKEGRLDYFFIDGGLKLLSSKQGKVKVDGFAGIGMYNEKINAYGITQTIGPVLPSDNLPDSIIVLGNNVQWLILRLGSDVTVKLSERFSFRTSAAWVPYAKVKDDDSHFLRSDLGEVPNVLIRGSGITNGAMIDAEFAFAINKAASLTAGYRFWEFKAKSSEGAGANSVNHFETRRQGFLLGFSYKF